MPSPGQEASSMKMPTLHKTEHKAEPVVHKAEPVATPVAPAKDDIHQRLTALEKKVEELSRRETKPQVILSGNS